MKKRSFEKFGEYVSRGIKRKVAEKSSPPTEAHAALASRNVRESQILKQGIWAMVKQHVMK